MDLSLLGAAAVLLGVFAAAMHRVCGVFGSSPRLWRRRPTRRWPREPVGPWIVRLAGAALALALALASQVGAVACLAQPTYGALRFVMLAELVAAAGWTVFVATRPLVPWGPDD
jgi:hypothetical protein